jgi:hypothetical protein
MRMFIPEIGTVFTLAEDWTFQIVNEHRNAGLAKLLGREAEGDYYFPFGSEERERTEHVHGWEARRRLPKDPGNYTWPAGTSLEVDRIYIRKGNEDFSSVTFKTHVRGKVVRFFARLNDVNNITF